MSADDNIAMLTLSEMDNGANDAATTRRRSAVIASSFTETSSQFEENSTLMEMNSSLGISSGIPLVSPVVVNNCSSSSVSQATTTLENAHVTTTVDPNPVPTLLASTILQSSLLGSSPTANAHLPLMSSLNSFMDGTGDPTVISASATAASPTVVNATTTAASLFGISCPTFMSAGGSIINQEQQKLSNNLQNFMFLQDVNAKTFGTSIGTPVVVLVNNPEKGTVEANVLYQHPVSTEVLLIPSNADVQTLLPNALVSQQLEKIHSDSTKGDQSRADNNATKTDATAEKIYCCEVGGCGKAFNSDWRLKYHQSIHSGVKTLECTVDGCGRKFSWPAHLHYHHLTHTGDRHYKCEQMGCGKTFYTAQRLNVHKRTHTGEKPYCCSEEKCNKRFTTAGNLKNHMRIHTGEKPYQCTEDNCNRKFAEYSSLRKHKLVHSGEKPFECNMCGKTFSQSGSCKVHMTRHQLNKQSARMMEKNNDGNRTRTSVLKVNNQLAVLEQGDEEEILQYRDFQSSETVVFSQGVSEHVVTVTTQQPDMSSDNLALVSGLLGAEEVLSSSGEINSGPLETSNSGASVLVLSQPHEMVSMATDYHHGHPASREEIVYTGDLLNSDLDHEEIANNISQHDLTRTMSQQALSGQSTMTHSSSTEKKVDIDPMMELDDENDLVETK